MVSFWFRDTARVRAMDSFGRLVLGLGLSLELGIGLGLELFIFC